jgi:hypothetical protein
MISPYKTLHCKLTDSKGVDHYYVIQAETLEDYDWLVAETIKENPDD